MAKMLIYTGQTAAIEIVALKTTEQALKQLFFFFRANLFHSQFFKCILE